MHGWDDIVIDTMDTPWTTNNSGIMYCGNNYESNCILDEWSCSNSNHRCNNILTSSPTQIPTDVPVEKQSISPKDTHEYDGNYNPVNQVIIATMIGATMFLLSIMLCIVCSFRYHKIVTRINYMNNLRSVQSESAASCGTHIEHLDLNANINRVPGPDVMETNQINENNEPSVGFNANPLLTPQSHAQGNYDNGRNVDMEEDIFDKMNNEEKHDKVNVNKDMDDGDNNNEMDDNKMDNKDDKGIGLDDEDDIFKRLNKSGFGEKSARSRTATLSRNEGSIHRKSVMIGHVISNSRNHLNVQTIYM